MRVIVLGAAAGGGFPQWNSNAPACRRSRAGDPAAKPRTQAGLAVSADGRDWFLLNASPDLRQQIEQTPSLQPRVGLRSSPIAGVVLTGGEVDAIAGLLTLRERQPLTIYATAAVHGVLCANPIFDVLARDVVARKVVPLDTPVPLAGPRGESSGLSVELFAVPGKSPLYAERPGETPPITVSDETVGAHVRAPDSELFFIPGCAAMSDVLADRLRHADLVFFDGTLAWDDEMIQAGIGTKTGCRMGHMSIFGPAATLATFQGLGVRRRIFLHINNSNPILLDDSPERARVIEAGWEVAYDGMEVTLGR